MATQGRRTRLAWGILALGAAALCCTLAGAQDILRFKYDVAGDSKVIVLHADEIATWTDGAQRVLLLRGKVLAEHGPVHVSMQQAVAWLNQEEYRKTGIQRLEIYAEGNVLVENGTESQTTPQAWIHISTRGEIKLRSHNGKINQQPQPNDPLYLKGLRLRSGRSGASAANELEQASFKDLALTAARDPDETPAVPAAAQVRQASYEEAASADGATKIGSTIVPVQFQSQPPTWRGVAPAVQPPAPDFSPPAITSLPQATTPAAAEGQTPANPL
ncbi:MAG TPA: hypothetical protein VGY58_07805, partial [Gemmataceae bacterium]|nr:hypothetical protein [Gemmataceae bacterium]